MSKLTAKLRATASTERPTRSSAKTDAPLARRLLLDIEIRQRTKALRESGRRDLANGVCDPVDNAHC